MIYCKLLLCSALLLNFCFFAFSLNVFLSFTWLMMFRKWAILSAWVVTWRNYVSSATHCEFVVLCALNIALYIFELFKTLDLCLFMIYFWDRTSWHTYRGPVQLCCYMFTVCTWLSAQKSLLSLILGQYDQSSQYIYLCLGVVGISTGVIALFFKGQRVKSRKNRVFFLYIMICTLVVHVLQLMEFVYKVTQMKIKICYELSE